MSDKTKKILIWVLGILVIALSLFALYKVWEPRSPDIEETGTKFDLTEDENLSDDALEGKTEEEIQEELNKMVEDSMLTIYMATNPIFESGDSEGNLLIYNVEDNKHPIVVEIYDIETEELIYRSGVIPIGKRVNTAKLSKDLPKGDYNCVAKLNYVDEDTGDSLGLAQAKILVTIKS